MLADKRLCHPLTVSDFASRYIVCCDALAAAKQEYAFQNVGIREVAESIGLVRFMQYDLACLITKAKLKWEIGKLADAVASGLLGPRHILASAPSGRRIRGACSAAIMRISGAILAVGATTFVAQLWGARLRCLRCQRRPPRLAHLVAYAPRKVSSCPHCAVSFNETCEHPGNLIS
jgi:hypothetical protein